MAEIGDTVLDRIGRFLANRLRAEVSGYEPYTPSDPEILARVMQPGDVLLVESNQYISKVIKYLTTSTWSHSAMFVGPVAGAATADDEAHVLVEVVLGEGCISAPMSKYATYNTRICRPVGLTYQDRQAIVEFMTQRIGTRYDLRNTFDMLRYFLPIPIPQRFRRAAIDFGSGDPTRAICSTMIAEAFQSVGYPILPRIERPAPRDERTRRLRRAIFHIRHHSLYAPRDFDLSPYFAVVKPTIERGFDYKTVTWSAKAGASEREVAEDAAAANVNEGTPVGGENDKRL